MIQDVKIRGFRCLRDVNVRLNPFTVLIGKNDSGKSAFLDALYSLSRTAAGPLMGAKGTPFIGPWSLRNQAWVGLAKKEVEFAVDCDVPGIGKSVQYGVILGCDDQGAHYSRKEHLVCDGKEEFKQEDDHSVAAGEGTLLTSKKILRSPGQPGQATVLYEFRSRSRELPIADRFARYLSGVKKFWLRPEELKRECPFPSYEPDLSPIARFERDGYGLPFVVEQLQKSDFKAKRYSRAMERIRDLFPMIHLIESVSCQIRKLSYDEPGAAREIMVPGLRLMFQLSEKGASIPVPLISEGAILVLGYLAIAASVDGPAHLLIEEPETGIHIGALEAVVKILQDLTKGELDAPPVQVVVTTHSPYLLDFVDPADVRIFNRNKKGETEVTPLNESPGFQKSGKDYLIGELWANELEEGLLKQGTTSAQPKRSS